MESINEKRVLNHEYVLQVGKPMCCFYLTVKLVEGLTFWPYQSLSQELKAVYVLSHTCIWCTISTKNNNCNNFMVWHWFAWVVPRDKAQLIFVQSEQTNFFCNIVFISIHFLNVMNIFGPPPKKNLLWRTRLCYFI